MNRLPVTVEDVIRIIAHTKVANPSLPEFSQRVIAAEAIAALLNQGGALVEVANKRRIRELEAAIMPFLRVYRINEPIADQWPDDLPVHGCIPHVWPMWADLKRIGRVMKGVRLP